MALGPWRRFFARIFDIWFFTLIICIPLLFFWAYYFPFSYTSLVPKSEILLSMCLLLAAFVADSVAYSVFGNTPGKALLGVKVRKPDGCKYLAEEYFVRNLSVWWSGLALGIPILNFVAMFIQYRRLKKQGSASYDLAKESEVLIEGSSSIKTAVFILGVIALAVSNSILTSI
ncbi:RDD family protein [Vreelandella aquamarina]|uniref:RDD family protein n=1 Tax=Vreelandella aquamarina TaxID=77097 RepID=UPI00384D051C